MQTVQELCIMFGCTLSVKRDVVYLLLKVFCEDCTWRYLLKFQP